MPNRWNRVWFSNVLPGCSCGNTIENLLFKEITNKGAVFSFALCLSYDIIPLALNPVILLVTVLAAAVKKQKRSAAAVIPTLGFFWQRGIRVGPGQVFLDLC